jgi:hypothetical protein
MEKGRLTASGMRVKGKSTVFFRGSAGTTISRGLLMRIFFLLQMNKQHPIPVKDVTLHFIHLERQFQGPIKLVIADLHGVTHLTRLNGTVAPLALDTDPVIFEGDFKVLQLDARQLQFNNPLALDTIDIRQWAPRLALSQ